MEVRLSDELMSRFGAFVAQTMGLHFPPSRWDDLRRGLSAAAATLGCDDAAHCATWLMAAPLSPLQLDALADSLTVGETYFFRDSRSFHLLASEILLPLIRQRSHADRRLRIWSAACCTGEEPYSIAIALRRLIPDLDRWNLTLVATDLNPRFLRTAEAGVFGPWSFRETPPWLKDGYFRRAGDGRFAILPEIRRMVRFGQLNLVEDASPSLASDIHAMDVIFCRNVLMYFTPAQADKVIHQLYRAQVEGGWLMTSPSELLQVSLTPYTTVRFDGAILHRKITCATGAMQLSPPPPPEGAALLERAADGMSQPELGMGQRLLECGGNDAASARGEAAFADDISQRRFASSKSGVVAAALQKCSQNDEAPDAFTQALACYEQGRFDEAVTRLEVGLATRPMDAGMLGLLTRCHANRGMLEAAMASCDRWIAADKLDAAAHYLRAVILQEQGLLDEALGALRRTLYLDPGFAMAHVAMGTIARQRGRERQSHIHLSHALQILRSGPADDVLPEADGVTARQMVEMINAMLSPEVAV